MIVLKLTEVLELTENCIKLFEPLIWISSKQQLNNYEMLFWYEGILKEKRALSHQNECLISLSYPHRPMHHQLYWRTLNMWSRWTAYSSRGSALSLNCYLFVSFHTFCKLFISTNMFSCPYIVIYMLDFILFVNFF